MTSIDGGRTHCDGRTLKWLLSAGMAWLQHHEQQVNRMNVFPVPDGDTGKNMLLTVQRAYQEIAVLDDTHIGQVAAAIAHGARYGARGNSGTILSMLFKGFADGLDGCAEMSAQELERASRSAVDYAYQTVSSVMQPVEGTILTVARLAAEAISQNAVDEHDLLALLDITLRAARRALDDTPRLLPVLREAGVVDSGGMGLVYLLEGMQRFSYGEPVAFDLPAVDQDQTPVQAATWQAAIAPEDAEGYGYDVQFVMVGEGLDVTAVREAIKAMGGSPLVDGDSQMIKVHVHVHDPGVPLSYAIAQGVQLDEVVVENMQAQYLRYVAQRSSSELPAARVKAPAVIAVASGEGLTRVMEEYGAALVIAGGQTMNPSTEDFLLAIHSLEAREILLLPNNSNIWMAAEQAAALVRERSVRVIPTRSIPQGIAALLAYGDLPEEASLDEAEATMNAAFGQVLTGEITRATRAASLNGIAVQNGEYIGLLDDVLVSTGADLSQVLVALLRRAHTEDYELVTLYYGQELSPANAQELTARISQDFPDLSVESVDGGQPLYPLLLSIE